MISQRCETTSVARGCSYLLVHLLIFAVSIDSILGTVHPREVGFIGFSCETRQLVQVTVDFSSRHMGRGLLYELIAIRVCLIYFFERTAKALPQFLLDDKKKKLYKQRKKAKQKLFTTRISGTKLSILLDNRKKNGLFDC
jgi:hypothetical protein